MTVRSILLRLLLSVALVLNGSGYAVASMPMQAAIATLAAASAEVPAPAGRTDLTPCHRHHGAMATGQAMPPEAMTAHAASPSLVAHAPSAHPSPDCCKSDRDGCACSVHGVAIVPLFAPAAVAIAPAPDLHPMTAGHVAPLPPRRIRPPIG